MAKAAKKVAVKKSAAKHIKTYDEVVSSKTAVDTIAQFEQWVQKHSIGIVVYSNWFIGIADVETTTDGLKNLKSQNAGSMDIAMAIETFFHKKGMNSNPYKGGVSAKTKHVYIHKTN